MAVSVLDGVVQSSGIGSESTATTQENAQDIANAQGTVYNQVATATENTPTANYQTLNTERLNQSIADNVNYKSGESYIDAAKSTVAGQLDTLLNSDSQYLKTMQQRGQEAAGALGMAYSSAGITAGQNAALNYALPIAQQDAETYSSFAKAQQAQEYAAEQIKEETISAGELNIQKAAVEQANQNINNAFTARIQGADQQSATLLQGMQNTYNQTIKELEIAANQTLMTNEYDYQQAQATMEATSSILQNYQITAESLMSDPDFLALGADGVNNALTELRNLAANSIMFVGSSQGVDLTLFVDEYLSGDFGMTLDTTEV